MKKVYIVMKNADFTEGRGPMLFDCAFEHGKDAVEYVSFQEGIYGSPQLVQMNTYGHYAYANGYLIDEVVVHQSIDAMEAAQVALQRQKALAKLTEEEKKLLGIVG